MRANERKADELRPVEILRRFTDSAPGSVLIRTGRTHVFCTACIEPGVPPWREESGLGWVTAEYDMLPGSTGDSRRPRRRGNARSTEIQRLVGRSLRAAVDMQKMGPYTIYLDCDVLQADGGTRTAAISGAYVALRDALTAGETQGLWPADAHRAAVAAVSVGVVSGQLLLDLDYREDAAADVDCNLAMTEAGEWIEVQATGEKATFADGELSRMLELGRQGIEQILALQRSALSDG